MFQAARKHMRAIVMIGVAAALVVGGVAAAQGGSESGSQANGKPAGGHPPGPPMMGIGMKGLTYAEMHVQKNGEAVVIRIDQGTVAKVGADSITLTENDGNEVTVAVDGNTKIIGKPGEETALADLSAGQQVTVSGPEGGTAESIMVMPTKAEMKEMKGTFKGGFPGGPMPPPSLSQGSGN